MPTDNDTNASKPLTVILESEEEATDWLSRYCDAMRPMGPSLPMAISQLRQEGYRDSMIVAILSSKRPDTWCRQGLRDATNPHFISKVQRRVSGMRQWQGVDKAALGELFGDVDLFTDL